MEDTCFTWAQVRQRVTEDWKGHNKHYLNTAKEVGCSAALIWKAVNGQLGESDMLRDYYGMPRPTRVRWSPNCSYELRDQLSAERERRSISSEELLEDMWRAYQFFVDTYDDDIGEYPYPIPGTHVV